MCILGCMAHEVIEEEILGGKSIGAGLANKPERVDRSLISDYSPEFSFITLQYYKFLDTDMFIEILKLKDKLSNPSIRTALDWTDLIISLNVMDN